MRRIKNNQIKRQNHNKGEEEAEDEEEHTRNIKKQEKGVRKENMINNNSTNTKEQATE